MAQLDGLAVLVTRPAHQAGPLCRLLEARGATALPLPLLSIGVPRTPERARAVLARVAEARWLIVTSPNAARRLPDFLPPGARLPAIACLGDGTRRALRDVGLDTSLSPTAGSTSEALLDAPELESVHGDRIIIVRGEGGRRQLEAALQARGARVSVAAVYRRRPTYPSPPRLARMLRLADVAVITSGEGLQRLVVLTPEALRARLIDLQLVAPSARVVQKALHLGFTRPPLVVARVSDQGFVDAIAEWHSASRTSRMHIDE